jgi:hypothetical protein
MWRYWISSCKNIILKNFQGLTLDLDRYISEDVTKRRGVCSPLETDVENLADEISSTADLQERRTMIQSDETVD